MKGRAALLLGKAHAHAVMPRAVTLQRSKRTWVAVHQHHVIPAACQSQQTGSCLHPWRRHQTPLLHHSPGQQSAGVPSACSQQQQRCITNQSRCKDNRADRERCLVLHVLALPLPSRSPQHNGRRRAPPPSTTTIRHHHRRRRCRACNCPSTRRRSPCAPSISVRRVASLTERPSTRHTACMRAPICCAVGLRKSSSRHCGALCYMACCNGVAPVSTQKGKWGVARGSQ